MLYALAKGLVDTHGLTFRHELHDIETLNLIKIDVQGYEPKVIAGLCDTITRSPKLTLLTEFWPKGICDAGDDPKEFLKSLRELDLTLHELKSNGELIELKDNDDLIAQHQGRKYTNLVGRKEDHLSQS